VPDIYYEDFQRPVPTLVEIDSKTYKFLVDGEKFPWHISEVGPSIRRLMDDLYAIKVEMLVTIDEKKGGIYQKDLFSPPRLGGIGFSWPITEEGFVYRCRGKYVPTLTLEFFARDVSTDIEILDERDIYEPRDVQSLSGDLYKAGTEDELSANKCDTNCQCQGTD